MRSTIIKFAMLAITIYTCSLVINRHRLSARLADFNSKYEAMANEFNKHDLLSIIEAHLKTLLEQARAVQEQHLNLVEELGCYKPGNDPVCESLWDKYSLLLVDISAIQWQLWTHEEQKREAVAIAIAEKELSSGSVWGMLRRKMWG